MFPFLLLKVQQRLGDFADLGLSPAKCFQRHHSLLLLLELILVQFTQIHCLNFSTLQLMAWKLDD